MHLPQTGSAEHGGNRNWEVLCIVYLIILGRTTRHRNDGIKSHSSVCNVRQESTVCKYSESQLLEQEFFWFNASGPWIFVFKHSAFQSINKKSLQTLVMHGYYYVFLVTTTPPLKVISLKYFSCMPSERCILWQFLMSWWVNPWTNLPWESLACLADLCLEGRSCQQSSSSEDSQTSSSLMMIYKSCHSVLLCAHSSEDWLSRTAKEREGGRERSQLSPGKY